MKTANDDDGASEDQGPFTAIRVSRGRARPLAAEREPVSRLDRAALDASRLYEQGWFCSEAVLKAANDTTGGKLPDQFVRMSSGFCEGGGGARHTCGALVGAVMAVGLLSGRQGPDERWEPSFDATRELFARFEELEQTWSCGEIAERHGGMRHPARWAHCTELCGACAGWVIEIAEREGWI